MTGSVIGNTTDFGSVESRFEPWLVNMNIKIMPHPFFDDPVVSCILCYTSKAHHRAQLLGGYLCDNCMEETLDSFDNITRVHFTPYASREERKAFNKLGRELELKVMYGNK